MRAKICGITNLTDAMHAADRGAWALGFNLCPQSSRFIEPHEVRDIVRQLPKKCLKIGIVLDPNHDDVAALLTEIGLDFLQVYRECDAPLALKQRMILSLTASRLDQLPNDSVLRQYGYVLLDAPKMKGEPLGGTGRLSRWDIGCVLAKKYRLILAGGLTPSNVQSAIAQVRPFAVDVASGVQLTPGRLDDEALKHFLREVHDGA